MYLYPGQHFNISLVALGQAGYPIPTTIFWEKKMVDYMRSSEYCPSPPSKPIEKSCTTVSFEFYSGNVTYVKFKLYPETPLNE